MDNSQMIQRWVNEDIGIDLFQIIIHLLEHIKPILICALIGALILGGVKFVSGPHGTENTGGERTEDKEALALEYEKALALYELQMESYNKQLQTAYDSLAQYEEYRDNSILLNMDPKSYYQKEFVWFVNAEEERTGAVLNAYAAVFAWDYYCYLQEHISERYEVVYLSELISTGYGAEASRLSLTISSPTEVLLEEISDVTERYLEEKWPQITEAIGGYEIALLAERQYVSTDLYGSGVVTQAQDAFGQKILTLRGAILDLQTKISGLAEPELPSLEESEEDAAGSSLPSKHGLYKNAVKYAMIGLFLGAFLSAGWLTVRFVMSDVVCSEDEIQRRFGVYILASVRRFNGCGLWQHLLSKLSGDANRAITPEAAAALACANLESMLEAAGHQGENVLLVGGDGDALSETERLVRERKDGAETPYTISVGGNVLVDQAALEQLQDYNNIVLVVRKGSTRNWELGRELEKLLVLKKNIVGLIAL